MFSTCRTLPSFAAAAAPRGFPHLRSRRTCVALRVLGIPSSCADADVARFLHEGGVSGVVEGSVQIVPGPRPMTASRMAQFKVHTKEDARLAKLLSGRYVQGTSVEVVVHDPAAAAAARSVGSADSAGNDKSAFPADFSPARNLPVQGCIRYLRANRRLPWATVRQLEYLAANGCSVNDVVLLEALDWCTKRYSGHGLLRNFSPCDRFPSALRIARMLDKRGTASPSSVSRAVGLLSTALTVASAEEAAVAEQHAAAKAVRRRRDLLQRARKAHAGGALRRDDALLLLRCYAEGAGVEEFRQGLGVLQRDLELGWCSEVYRAVVGATATSSDTALALWASFQKSARKEAFAPGVLRTVVLKCLEYSDDAAARDVLAIASRNGAAAALHWVPIFEHALRCEQPLRVATDARADMVALGVAPTYACLILHLQVAVDACRRRSDPPYITALALAAEIRSLARNQHPEAFLTLLHTLFSKTKHDARQAVADFVESGERPSMPGDRECRWLQGWERYLPAEAQPKGGTAPLAGGAVSEATATGARTLPSAPQVITPL
eukprot:Rhum_TRINITY_DN14439_c8_g1::Rhum_TRINITY_DN14439_c8_g1_i1::g.92052::m.92052